VLSALANYKCECFFHGNICGTTIYIDPFDKVKIIDSYILRLLGRNTYAKYLNGPVNEKYFPSRKLIQGKEGQIFLKIYIGLKERKQTPFHDPFKSDIFSLGMTLIEMMNLRSIDSIYDFRTFDLDMSLVTNYIQEAAKTYPPDLIEVVSKMVADDEVDRPDAAQLLKELEAKGKNEYKRLYSNAKPEEMESVMKSKQSKNPQNYKSVVKNLTGSRNLQVSRNSPMYTKSEFYSENPPRKAEPSDM